MLKKKIEALFPTIAARTCTMHRGPWSAVPGVSRTILSLLLGAVLVSASSARVQERVQDSSLQGGRAQTRGDSLGRQATPRVKDAIQADSLRRRRGGADSLRTGAGAGELPGGEIPREDTLRRSPTRRQSADWYGDCSWTHPGGVLAVGFAGDGVTAYSAATNGTIKFWDVDYPVELKRDSVDQHFSAAAFSMNGLLAWSRRPDNVVSVREVLPGGKRTALGSHNGWVRCMAIARDGSLILSGGEDHTIRVWDVGGGKLRAVLQGHKDWVNALALSADGKIAVSGGQDRTVRVWDLAQGKALYTLRAHKEAVLSVAISPDGRSIVSGGMDGTIIRWTLGLRKAQWILAGHRERVTALCFSVDGRRVVSGSYDSSVKVWDTARGRTIRLLSGHRAHIDALTFAPGQPLLLSGGGSEVKLWDVDTGRESCAKQ